MSDDTTKIQAVLHTIEVETLKMALKALSVSCESAGTKPSTVFEVIAELKKLRNREGNRRRHALAWPGVLYEQVRRVAKRTVNDDQQKTRIELLRLAAIALLAVDTMDDGGQEG